MALDPGREDRPYFRKAVMVWGALGPLGAGLVCITLAACFLTHYVLARKPQTAGGPSVVVTNFRGRRFTGHSATSSTIPIWCCRSRGIAALSSASSPASFILVLRSALAALSRALCCGRYVGPTAHPAARGVHFPYGVADAIGHRDYMEDRHLGARLSVAPLLRATGAGDISEGGRCSVFGVYDGHAGAEAAE